MDRVPIQTYVAEYNDEIVREAIARELARGGQVYYVSNKVKNIAEVAAHVQELAPDASVAYAHGQMKERELEQIMYDFVSGSIDVLVSTTIIETGLDIPNVNTIIIADSDRFGLSQLYQLRGRVGRSNRTAYAFLFYKGGRLLKEVAEKRLQAILDYTELGSGVRISMRDREIRGAGNLLGAEQHGHMKAVGYELYSKMLGAAVREERGEAKEFSFDTTVDLSMDANIPASYIRNESQKMDIYRRIAGIGSRSDYEDMLDELIDRFGSLPKPVDHLLKIALLRAEAHGAYVTEIAGDADFPELDELFIRLTQAIYVMDAVDDLEEDYTDGTFNPFLVGCPRFINRDVYVKENLYTLASTLNGIIGKLQAAYSDVRPRMKSMHGAADNIVYLGIPEAAKDALAGRKTAKPSVKNALDRRKDRTSTY